MKMNLCKAILVVMIGFASIGLNGCSGCNSGPSGKYQDSSGALSVEFKGGGKATVTMMGMATDATYTVDGDKITVEVRGDKTVFTLNKDGSLAGPSGSLIGNLQKVK